MRRLRVLASSGLVVALFASGCTADPEADGDGIQPIEVENDEDEAAPEPEPEPEPESEPEVDPEPEVEPTDPFAFDDPAEIDVDYVDRVMAELLAVESAVLDDVLESDTSEGLEDRDSERLRAVLSGPRLVDEAQAATARAKDLSVRSAFLDSGQRIGLSWSGERVAIAEAGCVVTIGNLDNSGVAVQPYPSDEYSVVVLSEMSEAERSIHETFNPTPWRIHQIVRLIYSDTGEPVPRDAWADLVYTDFLSMPCKDELT